MSTKHTPGPWSWEEGQPQIVAEWNGKSHVIASVAESRLGWHEDRVCEGREKGANARLIAAAPELLDAVGFARAALEALKGYEADCGEPLPDDHELGRIDDSRHSPSFRIRVGNIRRLAAALAKAEGRS